MSESRKEILKIVAIPVIFCAWIGSCAGIPSNYLTYSGLPMQDNLKGFPYHNQVIKIYANPDAINRISKVIDGKEKILRNRQENHDSYYSSLIKNEERELSENRDKYYGLLWAKQTRGLTIYETFRAAYLDGAIETSKNNISEYRKEYNRTLHSKSLEEAIKNRDSLKNNYILVSRDAIGDNKFHELLSKLNNKKIDELVISWRNHDVIWRINPYTANLENVNIYTTYPHDWQDTVNTCFSIWTFLIWAIPIGWWLFWLITKNSNDSQKGFSGLKPLYTRDDLEKIVSECQTSGKTLKQITNEKHLNYITIYSAIRRANLMDRLRRMEKEKLEEKIKAIMTETGLKRRFAEKILDARNNQENK